MRRSLALLAAVVATLGGCASPGESPPTATVLETTAPRLSASQPVPSLDPETARAAGWRADLDRLITAREEIHPEPWHGIDRAEYVAAVEAVSARVPELTDDELLVEVTRLAAMPTWAGRDGHGGIYPWGEGSYGVHMYPLRLYWFSDGIFVVDALSPHTDLIGARVIAVNGHPADSVAEQVEPLVPRDNEQQVLTHAPPLMIAAEVLHGLGLVDDPAVPTTFTLMRGDDEIAVAIEPVPMERWASWAGGHHAHAPPPRDGVPWLSRYSEPLWWELQADTGTAYVQYNFVGGGAATVAEEVEAASATGGVARLVVDVRLNPGGNNTVYGPLVRLIRDAAVSLPGRVYLIMGRATFSAAGNFVTEVERSTDAILVGEDSGGSPNQYGDSRQVPLEHSGLIFRVAPQYITRSDPDDPRITVSPDLPAALSSEHYFTDRDPAMEAILADAG
jgi:hypothetical protein